MDARGSDRAPDARSTVPGARRGPGPTAVLWLHRSGRLVTALLAGWGVYHLVLEDVDDGGRLVWAFVPVWALSAYVLLPSLNRVLTGLYVPHYFIGRARTADGLLGDPVNLAVTGSPERLAAAMRAAGWTAADPLTPATAWHISRAAVLHRSYPAAPVSPLYVFGRRQALAFEREVADSPAQRHHVRFWVCPPGWRLPGGALVDLVGAATFDRRVGLSLFTLQVTHKVAARTDAERDLVVAALRSAGARVHVLRNFSSGYHARNGGGDSIETDGHLPVLDVRAAPPAERPGVGPMADESPVRPPRRAGPAQTYGRLFGAGESTDRTVYFSDAVFAIAMTLLVLELILPGDLPPERLEPALRAHLPQFLAYVLSFAVIGTAWMSHHRRFTVIRRIDGRLQWLNLLSLFFIALLPMPTSLLSDYGGSGSPWPAALYAAVSAAVYASLNLVWAHAWHAGLMAPEVDAGLYRYVLRGLLPAPVVFALSIPVAFWDPGLAAWSWLLIVPVSAADGWWLRRSTAVDSASG